MNYVYIALLLLTFLVIQVLIGGTHPIYSLPAYAVLALAVCFVYTKIPAGFLPDEDQGSLFVIAQLPPGATQDRTLKVIEPFDVVIGELRVLFSVPRRA